MFMNEAEKVFYEDVREKKRTASGVHGKTGKRGYVGTMRFPSDIMSRKDKYQYRKAGKVMTTNMYNEILTLKEFNNLETYEKKNRLQYWRTQFTNDEIRLKMGIGNNTLYKIIKELDLPKAPRTERKPRTATAIAIEKAPMKVKEEKETVPVEKPIATPVQEIMINGIHFVYNGTYSAEHIQNQMLKFAALLDGEKDQFYVELKIMQKPPKE